MVFELVTSDGDVMTPLLHKLRFNTEAYIKYLEEEVLLWIERVDAGRPYIWQQGSAPYHTSRTQSWL